MIEWTRHHGGTLVSEDTRLGFFTITKRSDRTRVWLHRGSLDSLFICDRRDEEEAQRVVEAFLRDAKPGTVHRTAKLFRTPWHVQ